MPRRSSPKSVSSQTCCKPRSYWKRMLKRPNNRSRSIFVSTTSLSRTCLLLFVIQTCVITNVHSGDLRDVPVPFRISLSLGRVSSYTDVVARSASAAHPLGSSVNPASYDFLRDPPFDFKAVGSLSSNVGVFSRGTWASGLSANVAYRLPEAGTISSLFVRTDSHNAVSEQGDEFSLRSNQFSLGYSQRISQRFSLGANIRITEGT